MQKLLCLILLCLLPYSATATEVTVSGGAGLKDIITELSTVYSSKQPGIHITKNWLVSGALAKQMDNGLAVDIVFVANLKWMEYLKEHKHIDPANITPFAYNSLVFIGAEADGRSGNIKGMQDLPKLKRIAIGSPKIVPAGEYAMEAIRKAGIENYLEKKLVMARDVRSCLMYAERNEVDGAFVYRTDAMRAKNAKILFTVPEDLHPRVVYMMALSSSGVKNKDAVEFYNFLKSDQSKEVLFRNGFQVR